MIKQLDNIDDYQARLLLQDIVDEHMLYASILYKGSPIWSRKRIVNNLKRIIIRGQLYGNQRVRWIRLNSKACLPEAPKDFRPILSEYFYTFLTLCCGSQAHYSRAGWIGIYPTLEDLKRFFLRNEHGKPVSEYIPEWKTDARRVVEDIERMLYPFRTFVKAKLKEEQRGKRDTED